MKQHEAIEVSQNHFCVVKIFTHFARGDMWHMRVQLENNSHLKDTRVKETLRRIFSLKTGLFAFSITSLTFSTFWNG